MALYLNQRPKDISKGFVFGSDPRSCDVLLANTKGSGISANHFSIQIDWVSRDPTLVCLSGNDISVRVTDVRAAMVLSKNKWQRLKPDTTTYAHVVPGLTLKLFNPARRKLQAAYNQELRNYFLDFKNAVPDLANVSLDDAEVTPLIVHRCAGQTGKQYCTIRKLETGDLDYHTKVFLYDAKCKPTPVALVTAQEVATADTKQPEYPSQARGK